MNNNQTNNSLSVYRHEKKFILNPAEMASLRCKLDLLMQMDPNAEESSYIVRSLYFDSINADDLFMKYAGDEIRKKVRLRIYENDTGRCKLEVKKKNGELQHKISIWISREDAGELCHSNYSVLFNYFDLSEDAVFIYRIMTTECYRPAVLVEYDRLAYIYPSFNTRITIDMNIRGSESCFSLFDPNPNYVPHSLEDMILEVKYNERLVEHISKVLTPYHLVQTSVSKYCSCREIFTDFLF